METPQLPRLFSEFQTSIWATSWQNQQMVCAPSEDSDQPGHPPSLISVFVVRSMGSWGHNVSLCGKWRLIRLGGCPGWSEFSLGAQAFCWFCHVAAHFLILLLLQGDKLSCDMTKPTKWLCVQRRLRSAWAFAQSDQSLSCPHEESLGPQLPTEYKRRLWSDWADTQAYLSLRWAHTHFVGLSCRGLIN